MALLNYSTTVPVDRTAAQIQKILSMHGATLVQATYDGAGNITGLGFNVDTAHGNLPFDVPINTAKIKVVLERQYKARKVPASALREGQPERIAWRIIKDWIEGQMALLETDMVQLEQIFLPYLVRDGTTLYDYMLTGGFKQLPSGETP